MSYQFTEDHEWISVDENDVATVGISQYASDELGEVVYVDLPEVGGSMDKGEEFGSLESVKTVSGMYAPVSGEIKEINQDVVDSPELINSSPMEKGWLVKIELSNPAELEDLMSETDYSGFIQA